MLKSSNRALNKRQFFALFLNAFFSPLVSYCTNMLFNKQARKHAKKEGKTKKVVEILGWFSTENNKGVGVYGSKKGRSYWYCCEVIR